jgi:tRNA(Ile)-lysidine synthase
MYRQKTIEQKVIRFILDKELIEKKDKILISFSGGPDSVFLLHVLNKYKRRFDVELGAFHLNHNLRSKDSDADEDL